MPLSDEKWQEVHHHFTTGVEICQSEGLIEDEINEEFSNVLENTLITPEEDQDYRPKRPKPGHGQSGS